MSAGPGLSASGGVCGLVSDDDQDDDAGQERGAEGLTDGFRDCEDHVELEDRQGLLDVHGQGPGHGPAAHIHKAAKGKSGNVVIPFFAGKLKKTGCVTASKTLV